MGKGFSRRNSRIYFWHSRAFRHGDSLIYEPVFWGRISPTKVGTDSPKALLGSRSKVPVCPTVPNPRLRMFLAAFSSRYKRQPHLQTWVLVDSVFLRISPQLEHSKAGVLWIHRNRDFLEYLDEVFKPDTELIPRCVVNRLGQTMVLHHVFDSQIFVNYHVVWRSLRTLQVLLHGAMRLSTYFEMAFTQNLSSESPCFLNLLFS